MTTLDTFAMMRGEAPVAASPTVAERYEAKLAALRGAATRTAPQAPAAVPVAQKTAEVATVPQNAPQRREAGTVAETPEGAALRRAQEWALSENAGRELLDDLATYISHFARFPSDAARDAVVLWAAHCHARDADGVLIWAATPRLMFLSRERGSGKSTALEMVGRLVPNCHGIDLEPSAAGITYSIGKERATICLDEGDVLFGAGKRKAELRAIINGGYTRHGTVLRMKGSKGERVPVFGPLALAGLDVMEKATGEALAPLLSRSVIVRMTAAGGELPDLYDPAEHAEERGESGRRLLAIWSLFHRDDLAAARPGMPEGVTMRAAQIWRPLLAVAHVAGGHWPGRAAAACSALVHAAEAPEAQDDSTDGLLDELAAMRAEWK